MTGKNDINLDDFFENRLVPAGIGQQKARIYLANMQAGGFLRFGIDALDKRMRLVPTELTLIGGRAGSGKTAFGMQIVHNALQHIVKHDENAAVAVFSAEMSTSSLLLREASAATGVTIERLTVGDASEEEYDRVQAALQAQADREIDHLYIDESPSPTLEHMTAQLKALSEAVPVRLVVFDYMELAGEFAQHQSDRVSKIAKGLKALAKKFEVPVVALAQLNRDIEKRVDKKVLLSDFMHGGEQSADIAIGLHRPYSYDITRPPSLVEAHVVKYRNGVSGVVENLFFNGKTMRFSTALIVRKGLND